jgi:TolB-like protein/class 3 adenylate cyclase
MAKKRVERRLAAIFVADVVGYSSLIRADEEGTRETVQQHITEIFEPKVAAHKGRIFKTVGDGLLAEFGSVVDAVRCAIDIQNTIKAYNTNVVEDKRVEFRIGVNLGDVIAEGDDLHGDGVNVAARLEGLAEPRGICISGSAFEQVRDKLEVGFEDLGEQQVKNIDRPVRAYRIRMDAVTPGRVVVAMSTKLRRWKWPAATLVVALVALLVAGYFGVFPIRVQNPDVEPASVAKMALPLPAKPSIAVLPFANLSGDKAQDYFADGMTEDIITDLSKLSALFVVARNSSFRYRGRNADGKRIGRELGVKYLLEGSVRRAGDRIRINAQLLDATTGGHLWAERYDGTYSDVFALQDKVTKRIVSALAVRLTMDDQTHIVRKDTVNVEAYDAFLLGWEHYRRRTPTDFIKAVSHFERAVQLDAGYGRAYAALALVYWKAWVWSVMTMSPSMPPAWTGKLGISVVDAPDRAKRYLTKAMRRPTPLAHQVASEMLWRNRRYDKAIKEAKLAVGLNPNAASGYGALAEALIIGGRPKAAVQFIERAMRLDPHSATNLYLLGLANFGLGRMEKAVPLFKRGLKRSPFSKWWHVPLAAAYAHLGREQDAQAALREWAGMTKLTDIINLWPFKDVDVAARFAEGVVKAGVCCDDLLTRHLNELRKSKP